MLLDVISSGAVIIIREGEASRRAVFQAADKRQSADVFERV